MTTGLTAPSSQATEHRNRWKWFLVLGVVLLVLGLFGLGSAILSEVTSLVVFGPLLLVSSLMQLLTAIFEEKAKGREALLHFIAAGLEVVLGFFLMVHPLQGMVSLMDWIAILLIAIGLERLARSLTTQSRGRGWTVLAGLIALLLGIAVWIGWSVTGLWFVGLCVAIDFICHGVSWSAIALLERKPPQTAPTTTSVDR